jgi:hypothetical protein
MPSPKDHPLAPPGVLCPDDYVIPRLASGPVFADAQSASLRENRPSRDPRAFLRNAISPWLAPRRGGLRTPASDTLLPPGDCPIRPPAVGLPLRDHVIPRLEYGLPTRTRGARPSEKTASRVISGFPPLAHPTLACPPPGGTGSARPQRWQCLHRKITPLGRPAFYAPMIMLSLGVHTALQRGRAERIPPRKTPFASSRGFRS